MTTDLEDRIRTALRERAAEVTPRRTARRVERTPHRWAAPLLAAAAVVVLAVAVAVAVTVHRGSGSDTGGTAAGAPAYAGYQWRVTSLQDRHGVLDVPPDIAATVGFTSGGSVYANDTVNSLEATYVPGESSFTVESAGTTQVGFAGGGAQARVIAAVDALFFSGSGAVPNGSQVVTVVATVSGDSLTLRTAGIDIMTVTLERQGPAPTAPPTGTWNTGVATDAPTDIPASATASDLPYSGPASPDR